MDMIGQAWPLAVAYRRHEEASPEFYPTQAYHRQCAEIMPVMDRYFQDQDRPYHIPWALDFGDSSLSLYPDGPVFDGKAADPQFDLFESAVDFASPLSYDGTSSISTLSSGFDGFNGTPFHSPDVHAMTPDPVHCEALFYPSEDHILSAAVHMPTICMHDVQRYADDTQPEIHTYEDDDHHAVYGPYAHEGYHPLPLEAKITDTTALTPSYSSPDSEDSISTTVSTTVHSPVQSPVIRYRRANTHLTAPVRASPNRISKRSGVKRATTFPSVSKSVHDDITRPFHCPLAPYGCEATFGSKNEWKRHVSTQHLRLGFWRCDQCPTSGKKPNDFNRKDLFVQHVRRMHPPSPASSTSTTSSGRKRSKYDDGIDAALTAAAIRCYKRLRTAPETSLCVICGKRFAGAGSWDERMEHLGRHFECVRKEGDAEAQLDVRDWRADRDVEAWMLAEGIVKRDEDGFVSIAEDARA